MGSYDNVPVWAAGHVVTDAETAIVTGLLAATGVNGGLLSMQYVFKPADTTYAVSSTTMQNDPDLLFPLVPSASYFAFGKIGFSAQGATPGLKVGFTVPAGAGYKWVSRSMDPAVTAASVGGIDQLDRSTSTPSVGSAGAGTNVAFTPFLGVQNGATAGNLQFQAAENVSSASNPPIIKSGSWLILVRYA